jgi:hypothetical protein
MECNVWSFTVYQSTVVPHCELVVSSIAIARCPLLLPEKESSTPVQMHLVLHYKVATWGLLLARHTTGR